MIRLFVYGTLKRNYRNAHFLAQAKFVCATTTCQASWTMVDVVSKQSPGNTYPAVLPGGQDKILGEIYEIDDATLKEVDALENAGSRYKREIIDFDDGSRAYMYINIDTDLDVIPDSGNVVRTSGGALEWRDQAKPDNKEGSSGFLLLDGGLGQELYRRGVARNDVLWSANAMKDHADIVRQVHIDFIRAGANIITINSYCTNPDRLARAGRSDEFQDLNLLACRLAQEALEETGRPDVRIAGSLPPLYGSYRPDLDRPVEAMQAEYQQMVDILAPRVDLFLCETVASPAQGLAAMTAAREADKDIWLSWTLDDREPGRIRNGQSIKEAMAEIDENPLSAVLFNCCPPEMIAPALREIRDLVTCPVGAYANGFQFIPQAWRVDIESLDARKDLDPESYAAFAKNWVEQGAGIIGGCCEIGPGHIRKIAEDLSLTPDETLLKN